MAKKMVTDGYLPPQPIKFGKTLFKVLNDGRSFHGGDLKWSLPKKKAGKWKPGDWHEVAGKNICCPGTLHVTTEPSQWYDEGATVYVAECEDEVGRMGDKVGFRRVRLLRPLTAQEYPQVHIFLKGEHVLKKGRGVAFGEASVQVFGNAFLNAYDRACVEVSESGVAMAHNDVEVNASGQSNVKAHGRAEVFTDEKAKVEAFDDVIVRARGSSFVAACQRVRVFAWDKASIQLREQAVARVTDEAVVDACDESQVFARARSIVAARGATTVLALDDVRVVAGGRSITTVEGRAVVRAEENAVVILLFSASKKSQVTVKDAAVVIDRRSSARPKIRVGALKRKRKPARGA